MLYGFRKEKRAKGQNMVEYALMLAIVVGIGWGIYDQAGLASSVKGVFADAGGLLEYASKGEKAAFDIQPSIDKLKALYKKYNLGNVHMQAGDKNTNRGILMDTWLDDTDRNDTDIAKLTEDLSKAQLTGSSDNYSNESVLSYYYDGSSYYVMKNRVWMDQKQYNHGQPGLASKGSEYGKPAAEIVGSPSGYSTYAEAQQAYEKEKRDNNNSVVFK